MHRLCNIQVQVIVFNYQNRVKLQRIPLVKYTHKNLKRRKCVYFPFQALKYGDTIQSLKYTDTIQNNQSNNYAKHELFAKIKSTRTDECSPISWLSFYSLAPLNSAGFAFSELHTNTSSEHAGFSFWARRPSYISRQSLQTRRAGSEHASSSTFQSSSPTSSEVSWQRRRPSNRQSLPQRRCWIINTAFWFTLKFYVNGELKLESPMRTHPN